MFVRVKSTPNSPRKSVQIVESVRDGDKVKQRIVRYVGIAMDDQELTKMIELAEHIKSKIEHELTPTLFGPEIMAEQAIKAKNPRETSEDSLNVNLKNLKEEQRSVVGIHEVYGKIYRELGFEGILKNTSRDSEILRHIVMARIANPSSKRASVMQLERDFGICVNLQSVYRMMGRLDKRAQQAIQDCAYNTTKEIFGEKIDVVFFDATTLYFESFEEDEFKQNGYSKDLKFSQPQVLIALMVTKQGMPLGYEAFPGSTYEGHTLIPILENIKTRYHLDKVVFVGDSGMLNAEELSPKELLEHYRGLWQVEESFRITKHDLKVRPIFHWTPDKVKAHLAISFMAFCCVRHLEYRVALQHEKCRLNRFEWN